MEHYLQSFLEQGLVWLPKLGMAGVILLIFWVLIRVAVGVIRRTTGRLGVDMHLQMLLLRTVRVALWIFGAITVFGTLGVDISALVAGLGLTGFALGFALKDSISNLLAGVLILFYRPFQIGDQISIAGFTGKVMMIDLRYTVISNEQDKIFIPNSKLFTEPLKVTQ